MVGRQVEDDFEDVAAAVDAVGVVVVLGGGVDNPGDDLVEDAHREARGVLGGGRRRHPRRRKREPLLVAHLAPDVDLDRRGGVAEKGGLSLGLGGGWPLANVPTC